MNYYTVTKTLTGTSVNNFDVYTCKVTEGNYPKDNVFLNPSLLECLGEVVVLLGRESGDVLELRITGKLTLNQVAIALDKITISYV